MTTRTISDRLTEASRRLVVGRAVERALLAPAVCGDASPFAVGFVHGPGGIGKSSLLAALASDAAPETTVLRIDGRDVEPTPRGLTAAVSAALGTAADPALPDLVAALADRGGRVALLIDTYEVLGLIDTWVRQVLVPALPASAVVVIAGRDRPSRGWSSERGWAGLLQEVPLRPLPRADAIAMLRVRGLAELPAARVNRFARGHPLALELAAAAVRADPALTINDGPPSEVIVRLLDALLEGLPVDTIAVVEAAASARRVTEPVLRALLDRDDVREAYDALQRLPFVTRSDEGLLMHDLVRDAVSRDLAERDPSASARYRRRAWRHFSSAAAAPRAGAEMWQVTADLIYLIKNPVLRAACFPEGSADHHVEPATAADADAILAIARRHEPAGAAELLGRWWRGRPEGFSVARDGDGAVAAFVHLAVVDDLDPELVAHDPVALAWRRHLARVPPRRGDRVLAMRRWLGGESGEMLSPAVGACWLDVKRVYMELRPRLSRLYSVMADPAALAPIFEPLGFAPIGAPVEVGGALQQPVWLDFGPGSVDGWLSRLVDAEIDAVEGSGGGAGTSLDCLSPREREVLALVAEGLSNHELARRLVISEKTAGRHVENIFTKLGVHNRAQATRIATECGLTAGLPAPG